MAFDQEGSSKAMGLTEGTGSDGRRPFQEERSLRRQAANIITQLPDDRDEALTVLDFARQLIEFIEMQPVKASCPVRFAVVPKP